MTIRRTATVRLICHNPESSGALYPQPEDASSPIALRICGAEGSTPGIYFWLEVRPVSVYIVRTTKETDRELV